MPKTITLLGGPARTAPDGKVGLLFECAPDDQIAKRYAESAKLTELIGEFDATKKHAHALASKLLEDEPPFQGVRQLSIFDELVTGEVQRILHAKALHDWLASHDIDTCVFTHPSRLAQDLRWISQRSGNAISVTAPVAEDSAPTSAARRSWGRIRATRFNRASIASEWRLLLDRVDPFHSRTRLVRKELHSRRRLWFYSTAYTFSRIGLAYEPYFPEPFDYLVENPRTGGVPLAAVGRSFSSPYDFATREMAPTRRGVIAARETIQQHIETVQLSAEEGLVRDAYLNGSGLATFMSRLLPFGLFQTQLFKRFVEVTEPGALIVGNPVFEGYALHAAQRAGVPTFLLQHGILGDFCQFVDPPADHYVVRGEFWREFLSPKARRRALVLQLAHNPVAAGSIHKPKRAVVFLTAPYGQQEFWDESDLDSILLTLLAACRRGKAGSNHSGPPDGENRNVRINATTIGLSGPRGSVGQL